MKYTVYSIRSEVFSNEIDAKSEEDARDIWELDSGNEELFFIEDEEGNRTFYD